MTVTISSNMIAHNTWGLTFTSTEATPTYRIYLYGELVSVQTHEFYNLMVEDGEFPVIEINDDTTTQKDGYPGRFILAWFESSGTDYYKIEEYYGGEWVERTKVYDNGQTYYTWMSRFLEDETTHQFRITPVGTNGNSGTALSFSTLMVRYPDVPDVTFTLSDDDQKITITEN